MKRSLLSLAATLVLSACSFSLADLREAVQNPEPEVTLNVPRVNRDAVEAANVAALIAINPQNGVSAVGVAVQMRDGRILYNSQENRGVVLEGGLIYATLGLGTNLQAVTTSPGDPLVQEAPVAAWPDTVTRTYFLSGRGPEFDQIAATCTPRQGRTLTIAVAEVNREVTEMVERCEAGGDLRFNNVHYLDVDTGRIWRSIQWTGPRQGNILIDIVEQFDPDA